MTVSRRFPAFLFFCLTALLPVAVSAQFNMTQLATVPGGLRSVWGYTDGTGREYALACAGSGLKIVEVTTPAAPVVRWTVPSVGSDLKEVKVKGQYAYVVNQVGALQIVDLQYLPDSATTVATFSSPTVPGQHTIWIDGNYVYLGMNGAGNRDFRILDISNPTAPVEVSGTPHPTAACQVFADAHDSYVNGNIAYVANLSAGIMSVDVTNKTSPVILDRMSYNLAFTHSMRTSADGTKLFTTDETGDGHLRIWDVSNPSDMKPLGEHAIPGKIIHNVFLKDPWLYTSYYTDGVRIFDVSDPLTPVIVGHYDTYPQGSGNTFAGCWDVYPYFASGTIVASDISNGLSVLTFNDTRAGYYEGVISDATSGAPIPNAVITWSEPSGVNSFSTRSADDGTYRLGIPASTVTLTITRTGYTTSTTLQTPAPTVTTTHNVSMVRTSNGARFMGTIDNLNTGHVAKLTLHVDSSSNPVYNRAGVVSADNAGNWSFNSVPFGQQQLYTGQWGRKNILDTIMLPIGSDNTQALTFEDGYEDNAELDLGWSLGIATDSAVSGLWERVDPHGTSTGGFAVQPEEDDGTGKDRFCFVTGNAPPGASVGANDVDGGQTTLRTPVIDLSCYEDPQFSYSRWYSNNRGSNPSSDAWLVQISNDSGQTWTDLENLTAASGTTWSTRTYRILDYLTLSAEMFIQFVASDNCAGSTVEAGVDNFKIVDLGSNTCTCCIANTGNTDGDGADAVDISDLTVLIDHLFISTNPLLCPEEGNIDGDAGGNVDISDLTVLIDHLFINNNPTAPCL